jgi:hypothetical protein
MEKSKYQVILENHGLTVPQILCGFLVYPDQMRELAGLYKALEAEPYNKALESKALGLRIALFPEQIPLI